MSKILVIGSLSIDNVTYTKILPGPGTTVIGESFLSNVGGKGANQACAATFLGGDVTFFGSIGNDGNGKVISEYLKSLGIKGVLKKSKLPTGVATITLDTKTGENRIVIVPGANMDITKADIEYILSKETDAKFLLIQLENPVKTVCFALKKAKELGLTTILNPAPFHELPEEAFPNIDYFVPNEHELASYVGSQNTNYQEAAIPLLKKGIKKIIVTLGQNGSMLISHDQIKHVNPIKVEAVDTTAAGDSYLGALVTALSQEKTIEEAMEFATRCSAITVTRKGAITSLPKLGDLK
ncbi:MAG TPA: ribokinase [Bacilli bacterium]|nr:ribokinase [Bacilli bacterium]HPS19223.1 ribokinase [Bacilli bacterium]